MSTEPGYRRQLGINERRYGFMEEGWTTAFEYDFNVKTIGKPKAVEIFQNVRVKDWIESRDPGADIPIITAEDSLTGNENYANNKYGYKIRAVIRRRLI